MIRTDKRYKDPIVRCKKLICKKFTEVKLLFDGPIQSERKASATLEATRAVRTVNKGSERTWLYRSGPGPGSAFNAEIRPAPVRPNEKLSVKYHTGYNINHNET